MSLKLEPSPGPARSRGPVTDYIVPHTGFRRAAGGGFKTVLPSLDISGEDRGHFAGHVLVARPGQNVETMAKLMPDSAALIIHDNPQSNGASGFFVSHALRAADDTILTVRNLADSYAMEKRGLPDRPVFFGGPASSEYHVLIHRSLTPGGECDTDRLGVPSVPLPGGYMLLPLDGRVLGAIKDSRLDGESAMVLRGSFKCTHMQIQHDIARDCVDIFDSTPGTVLSPVYGPAKTGLLYQNYGLNPGHMQKRERPMRTLPKGKLLPACE